MSNYTDLTRYDGTRFITEEEIDKEFTGKWVLITIKDDFDHAGYLVASAEGRDELRPELSDIAMDEFDCRARIIYGCATRGTNYHVELLD